MKFANLLQGRDIIITSKTLLKPSEIDQRTQWQLASVTALITYIIMIVLTIPKVEAYAGTMVVPDLMPNGYSSDYLFMFLETIGPEGRQAYLVQLGLDFVYPFTLAFALFLGFKQSPIISRLHNRLSDVVIVSPWTIMVFDYLENLMIFSQIIVYPIKLEFVGTVAPVFSVIKSLMTTVCLSMVLVLVFVRLKMKLAILTIPTAGLIGLVAIIIRGPIEISETMWVSQVSSDEYALSGLLLIIAYLLPFFGFLELYRKDQTTINYSAFLLSVFGTALALPTMGIVVFAAPQFAITGGSFYFMQAIMKGLIIGIPAAVCYTLGPLLYLPSLFGLSEKKVYRVGCTMFGLHGTLLAFGFGYFPLLVAGWVFLILGGIGLTNIISKNNVEK